MAKSLRGDIPGSDYRFWSAHYSALFLLEQLIVYRDGGSRICKLDETGMTTVQKVPKVISTKRLEQVGQIAFPERGDIVTLCGIVSVSSSALPPAYVFPREEPVVHLRAHLA